MTRSAFAKFATIVATLATLTLCGCLSQNPETPAQRAAGDYAEMNFDLDKCMPIEPNLYKCPATDKPLCTIEFARTDVECVHIGPKGSVFLSKTSMF